MGLVVLVVCVSSFDFTRCASDRVPESPVKFRRFRNVSGSSKASCDKIPHNVRRVLSLDFFVWSFSNQNMLCFVSDCCVIFHGHRRRGDGVREGGSGGK